MSLVQMVHPSLLLGACADADAVSLADPQVLAIAAHGRVPGVELLERDAELRLNGGAGSTYIWLRISLARSCLRHCLGGMGGRNVPDWTTVYLLQLATIPVWVGAGGVTGLAVAAAVVPVLPGCPVAAAVAPCTQ